MPHILGLDFSYIFCWFEAQQQRKFLIGRALKLKLLWHTEIFNLTLGETNISTTTLTNSFPSLQPLLHPIIASMFPKQSPTSVIYYVHNLHLITNHIDETVARQLNLISFFFSPNSLFNWVSYQLSSCWRRLAPSVSTISPQFQVKAKLGINKRGSAQPGPLRSQSFPSGCQQMFLSKLKIDDQAAPSTKPHKTCRASQEGLFRVRLWNSKSSLSFQG